MKDPIPQSVIADLQAERQRQLTRGAEGKLAEGGGWDYEFDNKNTPSDWAAYMTIYIGRGVETGKGYSPMNFRENMVKVATLAIAAIEAVDRNGAIAKRHFDI